MRPTQAVIHLQHLEQNMSTILDLAGPKRFVCPMIKADAYGHGAIVLAEHILKNHKLPMGVVLVEEALELRRSGIRSEIIVFGGFDVQGAREIIDAQLTPVVSQWGHLEILAQVVQSPLEIHVKFNTGMNRLGFDLDEADQVKDFLKKNPRLKMSALLSHLHSAHLSDQIGSKSQEQAQQLVKIAEHFKEFGIFIHLLNSDAIACLAKVKDQKNYLSEYNWGFRPGIMLYGYLTPTINSPLKLKPVMTLKSHIQQIRKIKKGETVSYNATWTANEDSVIGVVPIGYADGIHRILSNRGHVIVHGKEIPLRGKVCMDFVMVDLTLLSSKSLLGAEVIFFGDEQSAETVAMSAETISYEILTSVSRRVPREYVC